MSVTTRESWKTFVIYNHETDSAKDAQILVYDAIRGSLSKNTFTSKLAGLANILATIIPLVFKRTGTAIAIGEIIYTVASMLPTGNKQAHIDGIFKGYFMYEEMKQYMNSRGYDALQVEAYHMDYTTSKGSCSLLFGNNSGTQLNKTFRIKGARKNGQWIYS